LKELTQDSKLIVKAKTTAADEIGIDGILKDKEMVSTDLGDFIMSIAREKDMHPVAPAFHLTPERISEIIKDKLNEVVAPTAKDIAAFARNYLREKFKKADTGISGANVITSDGRIVLLENEGNISLVSRLPDKHIVIAGWEKIVPTVEDAMKVVRATTVWASGIDWPVYVSIISGPSKTADIRKELIIGAQGAKEVYLILLDNGRSKMLEDGFEELLYCINCGACLYLCPAYHQLGTKYGDKYLGSKGVIMSAFMVDLLRAKDSGCYSCTLCSACSENCPVKINLPELMRKIREKLNKENQETDENKKMIANIRKFGNPFGEMEEGKTPKELYCC
jgi:iron-sulfur cluster protein